MTSFASKPCDANQWGQSTNASIDAFGLTAAGEFSLAVTDCAKWLAGVKNGYRYDGTYPGSSSVGSCDPWMDWQSWDDGFKQSMMQFALSSMDALQASRVMRSWAPHVLTA
jgi:glucan 1,3-beta-glucosidase